MQIPSNKSYNRGFVLVLVVAGLVILLALGTGILSVAYGVRHRAIRARKEAAAMLVADAAYEQGIYWMSRQADVLDALEKSVPGSSGTLYLPEGYSNYNIGLFSFVGSRPVYSIVCQGYSGAFSRIVDVKIMQATGGWESSHTIPVSATQVVSWPFTASESIYMPISVHKLRDSPDMRDIYITGTPTFEDTFSVAESRNTHSGIDKYADVMGCFQGGIYFDQPQSKVTDYSAVQLKIDRFKNATKSAFIFRPVASAALQRPHPAVHLEFFVENGIGKVRITNNCTVRGFQRFGTGVTYDYKVNRAGTPKYQKYDIYSYHVRSKNADGTGQRAVYRVEDTYVTQSCAGAQSEPGGQIFVDGNVIIGSGEVSAGGISWDVVAGRITVAATGNIWIANSITVDAQHDADGRPSLNNPNVLGLTAQGVIKVVDPGMSDYSYVDDKPVEPVHFVYVPIAIADKQTENKGKDKGKGKGKGKDKGKRKDENNHLRHLPSPMVIEAAMTIGGGGWGAENVGQRKNTHTSYDKLVVRGSISEAVSGLVGTGPPLWPAHIQNGYTRHYYFDKRLFEGILPGNVWLHGKFIPGPAGWRDYRPDI